MTIKLLLKSVFTFRSSLNFFVSEYDEGFSIIGPSDPGKIIEGDTVEVTCGVSVYKYK
jgi:hypothetical protein